jgi:hypothetical protein
MKQKEKLKAKGWPTKFVLQLPDLESREIHSPQEPFLSRC